MGNGEWGMGNGEWRIGTSNLKIDAGTRGRGDNRIFILGCEVKVHRSLT
ncbi:MAG: hypothetical protein F6K47_10145 [Symploca sp. SIO2E6]|nr:hypothetical protein [Symploca sp. SIO2E6]